MEEASEAYGDFLFTNDKPVEEKIFNGELKAILRTKLEDLNEQQLMVSAIHVEELNVYEIAENISFHRRVSRLNLLPSQNEIID